MPLLCSWHIGLCSYVFCRQRQDESLRRGGEQAAVVVLAAAPLSGVLLPVSLAAGHAFFSEGQLALAQVRLEVMLIAFALKHSITLNVNLAVFPS